MFKFPKDLDVRLFVEVLFITCFVSILNILNNIWFGYSFTLNIKWLILVLVLIKAIYDIFHSNRINMWKFIVFGLTIYFLLPLAFFEIGAMNLIHISYAFLLTVIIGFLTTGRMRLVLLISHILINGSLFMLTSFYPEVFPANIQQSINESYVFLDVLVQLMIALFMSGYLTMRFSNVWRRAHEEINIKNTQLEWLANHDELTKVYNRRFLVKYVSNIKGTSDCRLIIIDIDNFKNINDVYGHSKGDEVLVYLASKLQSETGNNGIVARFGGDEFVIFMYDIDAEKQNRLYQKISDILSHLHISGVGDITVSGGSVTFNSDEDFSQKLNDADKLLYWAKKHGKNQIKLND